MSAAATKADLMQRVSGASGEKEYLEVELFNPDKPGASPARLTPKGRT
jgi:hypothetical protein